MMAMRSPASTRILKLVQPDLERGPLYHAYQIMSPKVITLQDDDDVAEA